MNNIIDFKDSLGNLKEKDCKYVIDDYTSREERHYCAYLFSWLLQNPENIKTFLLTFDKPLIDKSESIIYKNVKLFYEFTWLRDIIYEFGRHTKLKDKEKKDLKSVLSDFVFEKGGDTQKKKPDLAIFLKDKGTLILIEAKFEEKFDDAQIIETEKYGEAIASLLGEEVIRKIHVALLGRDYYLDKIRGIIKGDNETVKNGKRKEYPYSCISWEKVASKLKAGVIKEEIEMGLENQHRIHPRT